jgi:hypothetical protein
MIGYAIFMSPHMRAVIGGKADPGSQPSHRRINARAKKVVGMAL